DRERCLDAGMDGYLAKPVRAEELAAVIDALASGPSSPLSGPAASARDGGPGTRDQGVAWDEALEYLGGDRRLLSDLIGLYLGEAPRWREELREAVAAGRAADVKRTAHNIKGSMSHFGARAAFEAAQRLEMLARAGTLADAPAAWDALERE